MTNKKCVQPLPSSNKQKTITMQNKSFKIVTCRQSGVFVNSHTKKDLFHVRIENGTSYFCVKETPQNYKIAITCNYTHKIVYVLLNKFLFN